MTNHLKQLRAREVMNEAVQWADGTENLRAAADRMVRHKIRTLLVRGESEDDLPGMLSSKDVVNMIGAHGIDVLDELQVDDACSRPAICVPETTHLLDCINLMRMSGIRRTPVLRGNAVVGILSLSDVFDRMLSC